MRPTTSTVPTRPSSTEVIRLRLSVESADIGSVRSEFVLATTPAWGRRATRTAVVLVCAVLPTAAWYVLAPGSLATTHLSGREPAGLDQLLLTIKNAGATLGRGVFLPSPIRYGLGLVLLAAPFVLVAVSSRRTTTVDPWWRRAVRGPTREQTSNFLRRRGRPIQALVA